MAYPIGYFGSEQEEQFQQPGFVNGRWALGAIPLLIPAAKLALPFLLRRLAQPKPPGQPGAFERLFNRPQTPAPAVPAYPGGGYSPSQQLRGDNVSYLPAVSLNGYMGAGGVPVMMRQNQYTGATELVDPNTGQVMVIPGPNQAMGNDDFDDFDDFDDIDDDDDDDDLLFGAEVDDDVTFAGKEERLSRKIERWTDRAERLQDRLSRVRWGVRRRSIQRKLDRVTRKIRNAKAKLKSARGARRQAKRKASATLAAAGIGVAAGAAGAAIATNFNTREGQRQLAEVQSGVNNPMVAEEIRKRQARAGLSFQVQSPAGSGRLQQVPMTQEGTTNPRNALTIPVAGITTAATLFAETLPFATVRLVSFISSQRGTDTTNGAIGLVSDLKIRGSGNLFMHEQPAPADNYDTNLDRLNALRDNPRVKSPNQAQVDIFAAGDNNDVVILTCNVIYDVIQDDSYGAGLPGPY